MNNRLELDLFEDSGGDSGQRVTFTRHKKVCLKLYLFEHSKQERSNSKMYVHKKRFYCCTCHVQLYNHHS